MLGDGRMFFAGGTHPTVEIYGEKRARMFQPGSEEDLGTWPETQPTEMTDWRWYPDATTLGGPGARAGPSAGPHSPGRGSSWRGVCSRRRGSISPGGLD